ncbi:Sulfite exporter TauE/SafE [Mycolicibacterium chlorophenolicum]|uniref:Probable membrane transporter protein n=1 Tax=Mycolicibacterium chlorophenolicum TaxID=37916 RepID=A0A0J6VVB7_9MYCO|nr:Sulfite exporter TauE/SafE [Mycolicibacterium chlorophenolicum]
MIALTVALAMFVGVSLGLLGGGGSILTVPLLAYIGGLDAKHAITAYLLVVGVTSAVGAIAHMRAGRVRWGVALPFGAAAMTGAYGGGLLARFIPGTVLLITFAVIMIAAAAAMLRGRKNTPGSSAAGPPPLVRMALLGVGVGTVSGLVGAGGGFLLVPALALLAGLPVPAAVGTSLVVIAMQSFAGLAGHLASEQIDWRMAAMVTAVAVVGALIGGAADRDGRSERVAQALRLVRPANGVGDPRAGDNSSGWCRGCRADGDRRRRVCHLPPNRPLSATPAHRPGASGGGGLSTCPAREVHPHG